jgi:hypothetical protein
MVMKIILEDKTEIEILAINFETGVFDWKRTKGYIGACVSKLETLDIQTFETVIKDKLKISLESELKKGEEVTKEEELNNASIK